VSAKPTQRGRCSPPPADEALARRYWRFAVTRGGCVMCKAYPLSGRVTIHSGFRTRTYNARVGGAKNSYHVYTEHDGNDQAVDFSCERGSPREWHATVNWLRRTKRNNRGGLGLYPTFVHADLRDYKADWRG
jgi:uncharacterized protein YcbK (DUF882 family)